MVKGLEAASRSLNINEKKIGALANNLANLDSTGYKRELPFEQIIMNENEIRLNRMLDFSQGELIQTDNPLDVAVTGDAFFVVENEGGLEFTKNGKFKLSDDGFIVDSLGNKLMGENGEIHIQSDFWNKNRTISINNNGEIYAGENYIDKLKIVQIENKRELLKTGNNNFKLNNGYFETAEEGEYKVLQGYLENSNVNPVVEMEEMIRISKDYESAQKMVRYLDRILEQANEIGRV